jgi:hypothetical protein
MPLRVRPPGTTITYCNYGIALAGYIVEVVSVQPFDQYVQEHILGPLAMNQSSFLPDPNLSGHFATGYWQHPTNGLQPVPVEYLNMPPAGQLTSTASDMARFLIAHLENGRLQNTRILNEETARQMHQRQFAHHPDLPGWCYGFGENVTNGHRTIGHAGGIAAMWSFLHLVPDQRTGFFLAQNGGGDFLAPPLIDAFMDRFFADTTSPAQPPVRIDPTVPLQALAGRYRFNLYPHTTIAKLRLIREIPKAEVRAHPDGTLTVHNMQASHIELPPGPYVEIAPLLFREVDGSRRLAFRRDDKGRITHLFSDAHWDPIAYDRLAWYDHPAIHRRFLAFCLLVSLSACLGWPLATLVRRLRKAAPQRNPRARLAQLTAGLTAALIVATVLALALCLFLRPPVLAYGQLGPIPILLILPLIATVLTPLLLVFTVLAWKGKYWTFLARLHYSLVGVAAGAFVPFLWYWNLLGFRY